MADCEGAQRRSAAGRVHSQNLECMSSNGHFPHFFFVCEVGLRWDTRTQAYWPICPIFCIYFLPKRTNPERHFSKANWQKDISQKSTAKRTFPKNQLPEGHFPNRFFTIFFSFSHDVFVFRDFFPVFRNFFSFFHNFFGFS